VTERVPAAGGQLDDDEQPATAADNSQPNHFDPNILKTAFKSSKSKKHQQSKATWTMAAYAFCVDRLRKLSRKLENSGHSTVLGKNTTRRRIKHVNYRASPLGNRSEHFFRRIHEQWQLNDRRYKTFYRSPITLESLSPSTCSPCRSLHSAPYEFSLLFKAVLEVRSCQLVENLSIAFAFTTASTLSNLVPLSSDSTLGN